jgi:hypothetical protein
VTLDGAEELNLKSSYHKPVDFPSLTGGPLVTYASDCSLVRAPKCMERTTASGSCLVQVAVLQGIIYAFSQELCPTWQMRLAKNSKAKKENLGSLDLQKN